MSDNQKAVGNIDEQYKREFTKPITRIGPLTILAAGVLSFMPALYLGFRYDAFPSFGNIMAAWGLVLSAYFFIYIIEPISYFSTLGIAGTYMSFLSGNIGNMRVPCAAIAQEVMGVEGTSKKGELVGTLAIAGSVVTNIIALTLIAFAGTWVLSIMPPVLQQALNYTMPILFGGMIVMFGMKSLRTIFMAVPVAFICSFVFPLPSWALILLTVGLTIGMNIGAYKITGKA